MFILFRISGTNRTEISTGLIEFYSIKVAYFAAESFYLNKQDALGRVLTTKRSKTASALCECSHNADAVLDRIVNSSHRINLAGESMRKANF